MRGHNQSHSKPRREPFVSCLADSRGLQLKKRTCTEPKIRSILHIYVVID